MIFVRFGDDSAQRKLPFFLAMEEWIAKHIEKEEYLMIWQCQPTVICGRNQDINAEANLEYCRANSIEVHRRKSGGGCVYADMGNLMISCISPDTDVASTFARHTNALAGALRSLGLQAEATGRNDILVSGRKLSGGAFYRMPKASISHSTLLFSTDMQHMLSAITPDKAKLETKKVKSVASRITTISELCPALTLDEVRTSIVDSLCDSEITLCADAIREIEAIEAEYYQPQWLESARKAKPQSPSIRSDMRIEGIGSFKSQIWLGSDGKIAEISLSGDFLSVGDTASALNQLVGLTPAQAKCQIGSCGLAQLIPGASPHILSDILGL